MPDRPAPAPAPPRRFRRIALVPLAAALATALLLGGCDVQKSFLKIPVGGYWVQLTPPSVEVYYAYPDWRGNQVVFAVLDATVDPSAAHIGLIHDDGTAYSFQAGVPGKRDLWPRWVNDSLVVFGSERAGNFDLWYWNVRDGSTRRLTFTAAGEASPAPRPGAPSLAYVQGASTLAGRIILMPDTAAADANLRFLTPDTLRAGEPDWDPTGTRVCFSAEGSGGTRHIWVATIGAADTTLTQLTTGDYQDYAPRFSPDGTRVLFTSEREGSPGVWVVDAAGESVSLRLVAVDDPAANLQTPAWSPDGHSVLVSSSGRFVIPGYPDLVQQALWLIRNLGL
jgi:tricorn protease-like protein